MDKSIENIINPPWLESIRKMEKQLSLAASVFQESETIRTIRKLSETTRLASLAFNETEFMQSARIAADSSRIASLAFHESDAMKSIRQFTESSRLATLALQESDAMRSFKAVAESVRLSSLAFQQSEIAKQLESFAKTSQLASIALQQSEAFKQISQISNLESFKALASLDNSPFPKSAALAFAFASEMGSTDIVDDSLKEIDAQISAEIYSQTDFNALSEKTKSILLYLYHYYFLPILLSCLSAYMMANAVQARKELDLISTPTEVRQFTRAPNHNFDRSSLKGFRVTTVQSLNFREGPSMKSEIITTLPIGSLVEVIDKSHRSWLLVEVEIDGVLEQGWVSRRYTAYFK
ncbi:SH3 domain-containing protein [Marinomonas sp. M1K-6]|uniref:SH3 domain-containing protein n=1 Tax=Marinomonas profundi TaxID=2726122 RepID=A0A847R037_9GAMM|nr:SH3 domain-containing protein [Marinomonas profundi]NLQ16801.1 SH3 domain-containing protein [Marinomonas profundi]UDV02534.1 SH3 domain-containing protein [Marinomonas profundi]